MDGANLSILVPASDALALLGNPDAARAFLNLTIYPTRSFRRNGKQKKNVLLGRKLVLFIRKLSVYRYARCI